MKVISFILKLITVLCAIALIGSYAATFINPSQFVWFSFLGLGFPILLTLNIITLLYWLVKRKLILIIPLVSIIFGANHISHFVQIPINRKVNIDQEKIKDSIHVMSYNVRLFDLYNWSKNKETRNKMFHQLDSIQPDIICFQEFFREDDNRFITRDTLVKFLNAKNYFEGHTHKMRGGQYFGTAIFSKYPIIKSKKIVFSNDSNNNLIYTDLLINGDTIRVFNGHVGSIRFQEGDYQYIGGKGMTLYYPNQKKPDSTFNQKILERLKLAYSKRGEQVNQVVSEIDKSPHSTILCGDFNDIPVSYTYGQLSSKLTDSFTECGKGFGGTYIGYVPGLRIDYIMHSEKFKAYKYYTHKEKLSDHRAISTKLYQLK